MKKNILIGMAISASLLLINGCGNNGNKTIEGKKIIPSCDQTTYCFKGLSVIEISRNKFGNGYFYERTKEDKLIPCDMTKVK